MCTQPPLPLFSVDYFCSATRRQHSKKMTGAVVGLIFCCLHYANPPTDRLSTHRPAGASLHAPRLLGVHGIYVLGCLGLDWLVPSRTSQPHGRHQRRTQQTALEYNSETTTKTAVGSTGLGRVTGIGFSHQLQQQQQANHNQGENRENRIKKHWIRIGLSPWQCNAAAHRFQGIGNYRL